MPFIMQYKQQYNHDERRARRVSDSAGFPAFERGIPAAVAGEEQALAVCCPVTIAVARERSETASGAGG